ncbi:hypothetical protein [Phenylobacterium sp.]|uniref:hypothetical protein n=1 Tax=Phenylobacterium sp. TaxID=1871053 RepID=UPI0035AF58B1
MLSFEFCLSKAEECEFRAQERPESADAREWLWMANEWRLAATLWDAPPDGCGVRPGDRPARPRTSGEAVGRRRRP